jgi:hypothetical protein
MTNENRENSLESRLKRAASDLDRGSELFATSRARSVVRPFQPAVSRPRYALTAGLALVATLAVVVGVVRSPSTPSATLVDVASGPVDSVFSLNPSSMPSAPLTSASLAPMPDLPSLPLTSVSGVAPEFVLALAPAGANQIEFAAQTSALRLVAGAGESSGWFRARANQLVRVSFTTVPKRATAPSTPVVIAEPKPAKGKVNSKAKPAAGASNDGAEGATNAPSGEGVTLSVSDRGLANGLLAELSGPGTIRLPSTGEFVLAVVNQTGSEVLVSFSIEG